ncbi:NAD-dependent epimerase/dehydratase family protein [Leptolyngbya sp. AN02str]|uniref:NAD-dependent epimerase/dehydratase family protein n=1 Tax=Leptolyngbya sp. AN02str TaxID=3423363 RepID=UPI003D323FE4
MNGLIGHTGFVGSNLSSLAHFDRFYNTQNIDTICGQTFETLICAAPQAKKWWANQNPDEDLALIQNLISKLKQVESRQFVLISSIDVFPRVQNVDETFDCGSAENHAYGRNRYYLEQFVISQFRESFVIRLPALFGPGLKKNVIFDLLNENEVEKINPDSRFQWYDITRLWGDVQRVIQSQIMLVMLATEPIQTSEISSRFFSNVKVGSAATPQACYDVKTCYDDVLGGDRGYLLSKETVLEDIGRFVAEYRLNKG